MAFSDEVNALVDELHDRYPARFLRMLRTLNDSWPPAHAPAHDIFHDIDERQGLFARWTTLCDQAGHERPNSLAAGVFLTLPIANLRQHMELAAEQGFYLRGIHLVIQKEAYEAIFAFLSKSGKKKSKSLLSTPLPAAASETGITPENPGGRLSPLSQFVAAASAAPSEVTSASKGKRKATSALARGQDEEEEQEMPKRPRQIASDPFTSGPTEEHSPGQRSLAFSATSPAPSFNRNRRAATAAMTRDKDICILTGQSFPEAAHISPYSATKSPKTTLRKISVLVQLWDKNLSDKWKSLMYDVGVTESARNIVCLNRHLHFLWRMACFGLKPLCTAEEAAVTKTVRVQFHWLPRGRFKPLQLLDDEAKSLSDVTLRDHVRESDFVVHRSNGIPIETGDVFTISADNADDLPCVDLLWLQWHLVQLASMAGFGEVMGRG